jgi:hypothetical protein
MCSPWLKLATNHPAALRDYVTNISNLPGGSVLGRRYFSVRARLGRTPALLILASLK